ncbi:MAG: acyl-CoA desaturase [Chromatiales bacterium]|jgi:stearoyl-CoA desaturase (delta-9 desaturase)|nr:MAG: acyl-CoA desaturase [Chromatiales bacterium]
MTSATRQARTVRIGMVGAHIACLAAIETGVSAIALQVAGVAYILRAFGVTAGFHRLLAHGAFKAGRATQFTLALLGSLATQGAPLWWVSHHRNHHRYSDGPQDLHSPRQRGFWYSHIGWMWDKVSFETPGTNVKELHRYPELKALQRLYPPLVVGQAVAFYGLGAFLGHYYPELGTTGPQMLVWGFIISTVALWHATFMVNSVCHVWGKRPHDTGDDSTNNPLVAALTLGEGWHNNHHKYGYSARHGLEWWQIDPTYLGLRALEAIGLVSDLKLPRKVVATA